MSIHNDRLRHRLNNLVNFSVLLIALGALLPVIITVTGGTVPLLKIVVGSGALILLGVAVLAFALNQCKRFRVE